MRVVENPRHRFEARYVDWLDEPPPARLEVFEEETTRKVLSRNESPDVPFRWSVNPYRGCTHACAYCYARPGHEYLGHGAGTDFETKIVVKLRAPELLRAELSRRGWERELIAFSGDTDCYQPLESHYRLTRRCLEACRDLANPVGLITKSHLVTRDLDVLVDLARVARVSVAVSIPYVDDALARRVEPGAPRPTKRFEALSALAEAGLRCGVMVAPILPGLSEDQVPAVLERARDCGARFAGKTLLRLPHGVKEVYLERMGRAFPDRIGRIESRVRETRGGSLSDPRFGSRMRGSGTYADMIDQTFRLHWRRLGYDRMQAEDAARPDPVAPGTQAGLFG